MIKEQKWKLKKKKRKEKHTAVKISTALFKVLSDISKIWSTFYVFIFKFSSCSRQTYFKSRG